MNHLSTQMNPKAKGMLPSDTLLNPKNDGHCIKIVTRSGKLLDNVNIVPKKVMNDKVNDGMKSSAPILTMVDEDLVSDENVSVDEIRRMIILVW